MPVLIVFLVLILLAALYLWMLAPRRKSPPLLETLCNYRYAHRGYHDAAFDAPENSLAAFRRAVEHGFGAELDVHLSKDGHLIVMHDDTLLRTCGVEGSIADFAAAELAGYCLEGTEEPIPLLEQVLEIFEGQTPLVVEVKPVRGNHAALCEATCAALDRYHVQYCMESFDPRAVRWLKKHRPEIVRGQLAEDYTKHKAKLAQPLRFFLHNLLSNFLTRPDFVAYRVEDRSDISFSICKKLFGVQEFSWTVCSMEEQTTVEQDCGVIIFERFDPTQT